ncbi:MAG: hypothetical protein LBL67_02510 [Coriobacteriales bacterium]|jgi:hypothetical protein|nr:hypothetical protein [Coriobacteriales bacterium]
MINTVSALANAERFRQNYTAATAVAQVSAAPAAGARVGSLPRQRGRQREAALSQKSPVSKRLLAVCAIALFATLILASMLCITIKNNTAQAMATMQNTASQINDAKTAQSNLEGTHANLVTNIYLQTNANRLGLVKAQNVEQLSSH